MSADGAKFVNGAMTDAQQRTVMVLWDDCMKLIAALKAQRWEVVKWSVALNLTIAGASYALRERDAGFVFLAFTFVVTGLSLYLIWHYNLRVTQVRARNTKVVSFLKAQIFDFDSAIGIVTARPKDPEYDRAEMYPFYLTVALGALPSLAVLVLFAN